MSKSTTRLVITVLTLITAVVHLVVLNINNIPHVFVIGSIYQLFALNGLGYLALLGALLLGFPRGQQRLLHYAYMAFAAVTIVAWYVVNEGDFNSILGVSTKVVELLLIVFLWLDLKHVQE